ncbi:ferritin [Cutibacterium acnes]|uniref:ferritin n=1 Tax=Cutibacterium acnes TaxID=1747 RepID=UPI00022FA05D|nr:ferritin [Cutibacterium acnes]AER05297.1 ferritin-like protein [Cutibacterium acnes subsp. defendens ATCC 11828]MCD1044157.1 ferritin [Cutibacterium acnes]MCD1051456.1 ferritin [Cutibacterium acnes]MCP9411949.1 ferritin [Cutibacterium acnes]MCP9415237.1 ferritin [Cutibacterium acnes]
MNMSDDILKAFNDQITLELTADMTYRQLAIEADAQNLSGMAAWLRHQADEEIVHANKFIDHTLDRGSHPRIGTIEAPDSALEIFQAALAHEEKVSEAIRELYRACTSAGDIDAIPLLQWFINEQIEEEATVGEIVGRIELIGDDGPGLLRLDAELGSRNVESTENEG